MAPAGTEKELILNIPMNEVLESPFQGRYLDFTLQNIDNEQDNKINEQVKSIENSGLLQPIVVRTVWVGAFITSLLFTIGKSALALYFGKTNPGSGYGAAGSIILIMLWTTYSSMIVFFGAELTKVYSDFVHGRLDTSTADVNKVLK